MSNVRVDISWPSLELIPVGGGLGDLVCDADWPTPPHKFVEVCQCINERRAFLL
jgi:hypothetical protein